MDLIETRELTFFIAVAEEHHFGRAAKRLDMTQPPLSRAIQQLEHRLGVVLFERTTRSVRLTPAGAVLLAEGRKALAALTVATQRVRRAGETNRRLRVATKPEGDAGLLEEILPRYRGDPDAVEVEVLVCGTGEAAALLRDESADVAFLHTPYDVLDEFDTEVLLTQRQAALLPRGHRLAKRRAIKLADLEGEPLPLWPGSRPNDARGPKVRDPGQLTTLVALGQLVAVVPQSVRRLGRTDVVYVPVTDAPRTQVVLSWLRHASSPELAAFRRASTAVAEIRDTVAPQTGRDANCNVVATL